MRVVIIIPTFNERDNITRIVPAIFASFLTTSLLLPAFAPVLHQFISIFPATLVNYLGQSKRTFRPESS
jgi:hypothetical protein